MYRRTPPPELPNSQLLTILNIYIYIYNQLNYEKTDIVTLQGKSGPPTHPFERKKSMTRASQGTTCRSL